MPRIFGLTRLEDFSTRPPFYFYLFFFLFPLASLLCNLAPFSYPSTHRAASFSAWNLDPDSALVPGLYWPFSPELYIQPSEFLFSLLPSPCFSGEGQYASGKIVGDLFPVSTLLCVLGHIPVPLWMSKRLGALDQGFSKPGLLRTHMSSSELVSRAPS